MDGEAIIGQLMGREGRADPYPLYRRAHALGAVAPCGPGMAMAVGHRAANQVLRNPAFGVADHGMRADFDPEFLNHSSAVLLSRSVLESNAPHHARVRSLIASVFTARRVAALEAGRGRRRRRPAGRDGRPGLGRRPRRLHGRLRLPAAGRRDLRTARRPGGRPLPVPRPRRRPDHRPGVHRRPVRADGRRRGGRRAGRVLHRTRRGTPGPPQGRPGQRAGRGGGGRRHPVVGAGAAGQPGAAAGGGLRDHHQPAGQRPRPALRAPGGRHGPAGRRRHPGRPHRRGPALRLPGPAHLPDRPRARPRRRGSGDTARQRGVRADRGRQPGPRPLRAPRGLRPHPRGQSAAQLRRRRALLPRCAAGEAGVGRGDARAAPPLPRLAPAGPPTRRDRLVLRGFETLPVTLR